MTLLPEPPSVEHLQDIIYKQADRIVELEGRSLTCSVDEVITEMKSMLKGHSLAVRCGMQQLIGILNSYKTPEPPEEGEE